MYNKSRGHVLQRVLLLPLSALYGLVLRLRHLMYDRGILKSWPTQTPTLCIGNLSLGGTGKTPMVEYLLNLMDSGRRLAVLSRGYGRKTKGFLLAEAGMGPETLGDEPAQIRTNYPDVPLAVDADRIAGVRELEKRINPDLILLDDAMQHRRIRPDHTLLLTDYSRLYSEDWLLPLGGLRDLKERACRAQTIVVTKCPSDLAVTALSSLRRRLKLKDEQELICCTLVYEGMARQQAGGLPLDVFIGRGMGALVTGIAQPGPLLDYLSAKGVPFRHFKYPDHHAFSVEDLRDFTSLPWQLTTQKDFVRLAHFKLPDLHYIPVRHQALWNGEDKLRELLRSLKKV